ncbi:virion structural protein [Aeromonas phage BUCT695]|uniref:virion structural protein n=1 Tax=Aeromonas phage BUCT695 TaxID=2908630 RepID=UPI0023295A4D|nr:virion structural protein [Aeromonas phage BUCT695]UIW10594.1 putative tail tubular protein [Aeromonas phage BUCT695]
MKDITNYAELKDAVKTWLNRRDQTTIANIPIFINFAEKQFTRMVRLPYYETEMIRSVEDYNFIEIPNDFLSVKHLMVNDKHLTRVDVETFARLKAKGNLGDKPYWFSRIGARIYTLPDLKRGDNIHMVYNRDIPEMEEETDAPYSLIIAPDVMLYLSLRHASIFLRDNEQEQFWAQKAQDAAMEVNAQLDEAEWKGSSLVVPIFNEQETSWDNPSVILY